MGGLLKLCEERRGIQQRLEYVGKDRVMLVYELPLNEVVLDFYDKLKSISKGYASLDYHMKGYRGIRPGEDGHPGERRARGCPFHPHPPQQEPDHGPRALTVKMKEVIPQQLFDVAIQAAIGSKIIARTNVKARRKDVLAKCYGGDISRKKKLLSKQKEGKKRMKSIGNVEIPQEAFLAILKVEG